jgi:anti-anti-sigma factor
MLKVDTEKLGNMALLHFQGRIVAGAEDATFRRAVFSQADASILVLDLSRIDVVDACGLGTFLELREWTQINGKEFRLLNPTGHVQQVFAITRLNSVFNISFGEVPSVAARVEQPPIVAATLHTRLDTGGLPDRSNVIKGQEAHTQAAR